MPLDNLYVIQCENDEEVSAMYTMGQFTSITTHRFESEAEAQVAMERAVERIKAHIQTENLARLNPD